MYGKCTENVREFFMSQCHKGVGLAIVSINLGFFLKKTKWYLEPLSSF